MMQRDPLGRHFFFVSPTEEVFIELVAANVPQAPIGNLQRVLMAQDGAPVSKRGIPGGVEFQFAVSKPIGKKHIPTYSCFFLPSDPLDAEYRIAVTGRVEGVISGPFEVPPADAIHPDGTFEFTVVQVGEGDED